MAGPGPILREIHRLRRSIKDLESAAENGPRQLKAQQNKIAKDDENVHRAQEMVKQQKVKIHDKEVSIKATQTSLSTPSILRRACVKARPPLTAKLQRLFRALVGGINQTGLVTEPLQILLMRSVEVPSWLKPRYCGQSAAVAAKAANENQIAMSWKRRLVLYNATEAFISFSRNSHESRRASNSREPFLHSCLSCEGKVLGFLPPVEGRRVWEMKPCVIPRPASHFKGKGFSTYRLNGGQRWKPGGGRRRWH